MRAFVAPREAYINGMKTPLALPLLSLTAATALLPAPASAARVQDAQQVMALDLNACLHPAYPAAALARRIGGKTTVELQIGVAGTATEVRLAASSGRADLDEAALAGIRRCTFPAVLATGQAPTGWIKMQYVWVPGEARPAPDPALCGMVLGCGGGGRAPQHQRGQHGGDRAHQRDQPFLFLRHGYLLDSVVLSCVVRRRRQGARCRHRHAMRPATRRRGATVPGTRCAGRRGRRGRRTCRPRSPSGSASRPGAPAG